MSTEEKMKVIRTERLKELQKLTGVSIDDVIDNFLADLIGCYSGGSDERLFARQWFLRNGSNYDFDSYEAVGGYLNLLQEPFSRQLESDDIESLIPRVKS